MKYCFYYDESEHSRVINLSTVTGETYYDGFLAAIIGWRSDHETAFEQRYHAFEEKYADRKKKGELKSGTIKPKQLVHGFASLNCVRQVKIDAKGHPKSEQRQRREEVGSGLQASMACPCLPWSPCSRLGADSQGWRSHLRSP